MKSGGKTAPKRGGRGKGISTRQPRATKSGSSSSSSSSSTGARLTVEQIEKDEVTHVASANWGFGASEASSPADVAKPISFDPQLVRTIFRDHLLGSDASGSKIVLLELSQYLEKYLWPFYDAEKASIEHVLSIVLIINEKFRQRVSAWDACSKHPENFSGFFHQFMQISLDCPFVLTTSSVSRKLVVGKKSDAKKKDSKKADKKKKKGNEKKEGDANKSAEVESTGNKAADEKDMDIVEKNDESAATDMEIAGKLVVTQTQLWKLRKNLVIFLINCIQSLEKEFVQKEVLQVSSIRIWENILPSRREHEFGRIPSLRKLWNNYEKDYSKSDKTRQSQIDLERTFLSRLIVQFLAVLEQMPETGRVDVNQIQYCERFLELLIDLEAQLPTRRFFNTLLDDHQVVNLCRASSLARTHRIQLFCQLLEMLRFYAGFEINDFTGTALTDSDMARIHSDKLIRLQRLAFAKFQPELTDLALSNLAAVEKRESLSQNFGLLSDDRLTELSEILEVRTKRLTDGTSYDRVFLTECLIVKFEKRISQKDAINSMPLYPDENVLWDDAVVKTEHFSGEHCLALPKLNLQFLTLHDYLLRNFNLFRLESTYEIREDIEDVAKRMMPRRSIDQLRTEFAGWSRMGLTIQKFAIVDVGRPLLGEVKPSKVLADISFSIGRYTEVIRKEWDALREHDVLFLLTIEVPSHSSGSHGDSARKPLGIKYVRGCEVQCILGDDGKPVDDIGPMKDERKKRITGDNRSIRVLLDANQYHMDMARIVAGQEDIYETFNVLMRRKPKENNFKAVLETIRDLMQSELVVPSWLHDVFLGYGDPGSAHYSRMPDQIKTLDFNDTFLDRGHLQRSFSEQVVFLDDHAVAPFIVTFPDKEVVGQKRKAAGARKATKKGKKSAAQEDEASKGDEIEESSDGNKRSLTVQSYKPINMGPYMASQRKKNAIEFTPVQVEAIKGGMNPGLSMVVGPPGTGKTDVAVQIIANLYHNFPNQHTLIVTHSNQALNQLFEKIIALDVDERHLLRLGHGEEELETEKDFSKYGRVNYMLERRLFWLSQVDKLAKSLKVPGDQGYTCETAGYFFLYHVLSRWEPYIAKFKKQQIGADGNKDDLIAEFPFVQFFDDAPQPLFPKESSFEEALDIAEGCFRYIQDIFKKLEGIRGFELLRSGYDRANYLLTKEAKIIAMTCTHAALKRRELVSLAFKYDNVIMEEAAQILEVETFIPLLLQNTDDGYSRLKRVIFIGDHNQLPPVVKNMAFQKFGNMEQSLFTRFVRLGVPTVDLDAQGRARSSIAALYNWRYKSLKDLPIIAQSAEYQYANTGFLHEFQAINVDDYQGKGETTPVPYFYQNLGEAEYVVATYQYMRLLGYPAEKISILTTYNGQKDLIRDVINQRCAWNPIFGRPAKIATVDKFQGQQSDYILLSLVRTSSVGHLRDIRRLVVAMSRARLGLYVFCRVPLFSSCYELQPAFKVLMANGSTKLQLVPNEVFPTQRSQGAAGREQIAQEDVLEIKDVVDMGKRIYERILSINAAAGNAVLPPTDATAAAAPEVVGGAADSAEKQKGGVEAEEEEREEGDGQPEDDDDEEGDEDDGEDGDDDDKEQQEEEEEEEEGGDDE